MKKLILIHGWKGNPNNHWFKHVKSELGEEFEIISPEMPYETMDRSKIPEYLNDKIGEVNNETILIGHSLGGFSIVRFLESLENSVKGVILVAPWVDMAKDIDFEKVKSNAGRIVCITSDNDTHISKEVEEYIKDNLRSENILEKGKGHFATVDKVFEMPVVIEKVREFSKGRIKS